MRHRDLRRNCDSIFFKSQIDNNLVSCQVSFSMKTGQKGHISISGDNDIHNRYGMNNRHGI